MEDRAECWSRRASWRNCRATDELPAAYDKPVYAGWDVVKEEDESVLTVVGWGAELKIQNPAVARHAGDDYTDQVEIVRGLSNTSADEGLHRCHGRGRSRRGQLKRSTRLRTEESSSRQTKDNLYKILIKILRDGELQYPSSHTLAPKFEMQMLEMIKEVQRASSCRVTTRSGGSATTFSWLTGSCALSRLARSPTLKSAEAISDFNFNFSPHANSISNEDFARVAKLNNYYHVFKFMHGKVFKLKLLWGRPKKRTLSTSRTTSGRSCRSRRDFLFGEQLKIQTDENDQKEATWIKINKIIQENYLDEKLYQSSVIQDVAGFTVFLVQQKTRSRSSRKCRTTITSRLLGRAARRRPWSASWSPPTWTSWIEEQQEGNVPLQADSLRGQDRHELWTTTTDMKQSEKVELVCVQCRSANRGTTELDYILYFKSTISKRSKNASASPPTRAWWTFEELNDRITQISVQLIKHPTPKWP